MRLSYRLITALAATCLPTLTIQQQQSSFSITRFTTAPSPRMIFDPLDTAWYYSAGNISGSIGNKNSAGGSDCYVRKDHIVNKTNLWITLIGGSAHEYCNSLTIRPAIGGILWISGMTTGTFRDYTPPAGEVAYFVSQLNATTGSIDWVRFYVTAVASSNSRIADLLYDNSPPKIYLYGNVAARLTLNAQNTAAQPAVTWIQRFGGSGANINANVSFYLAFSTPATSSIESQLILCGQSNGTLGGSTNYGGGVDAAVVKLNADTGLLESSQLFGGTGTDEIKTLMYDSKFDSLFLLGTTNSPRFGDGEFTMAGFDMFVMRLAISDLTKPTWLRLLGSTGDDYASNLLFHPSTGNIYVTGQVTGFVGLLPEQTTYGNGDIYVASLKLATGQLLSLRVYGTPFQDSVENAYFDSNDRLVLHGLWGDRWAFMLDSSTQPAVTTTNQGPTATAEPSSPNFINSIFTDPQYQMGFFVATCLLGCLVLILCVGLWLVYRRQSGRGGDDEGRGTLKNSKNYLMDAQYRSPFSFGK